MAEVRCRFCGERAAVRTDFEAEGECPECGAEAGSLEVLDPYDDPEIERLLCAECGFRVEAGVEIAFDFDQEGQTVFSVDDDCPLCEAAGYPGQPLEPEREPPTERERPEYAKAVTAARRLLDEQNQDRPPIDVEKIAVSLGLTVRRGLFRHDGLLRGEVIEVPTGHRGAERFVIAHEVGHHCLRHEGSRQKVEPEANAFASELLIPRALLRAELKHPASINALAARFGASRQAVFYAVRGARLADRLAR